MADCTEKLCSWDKISENCGEREVMTKTEAWRWRESVCHDTGTEICYAFVKMRIDKGGAMTSHYCFSSGSATVHPIGALLSGGRCIG